MAQNNSRIAKLMPQAPTRPDLASMKARVWDLSAVIEVAQSEIAQLNQFINTSQPRPVIPNVPPAAATPSRDDAEGAGE
jgi:hypothetical protein